MFLKKEIFHKLVNLVIQAYIELLEIINYFTWKTYSCSKIGMEKKTRTMLFKQPRQESIVSLSQKTQLTDDAILGKNEYQLKKKAKKIINPTNHPKF